MKSLLTIPLACLLTLGLTACGDSGVDAKEALSGALENLDIDFSAEGATEKVNEVVKSSVSKIDEIKDLASAESITEKLGPALDMLKKAKTTLGEKMPDTASLTGLIETLKSKFAGKTDILGALKPLIEKIQALM
ncbi:MAG: hypothetical protein GY711_00615 [bacterium]|nr:hypothetical protein [bacterium]